MNGSEGRYCDTRLSLPAKAALLRHRDGAPGLQATIFGPTTTDKRRFRGLSFWAPGAGALGTVLDSGEFRCKPSSALAMLLAGSPRSD